jgi:hypothetical protein
MAEPVLTARMLNRALLARQLLLEPSELGIVEAIEQVGGLQTQYSPSGYVGLWSRLRDFRRESLTEALVDRSVIQATMMRATIHIASASDYRLMAAATRSTRQEWWMRTLRRQMDGIDMSAVAATTRAILSGGPLPATEIQARLAAQGLPRLAWASVGQWLDMVRVPPSGTWARRKADLFGLADQWLGSGERGVEAGATVGAADGTADAAGVPATVEAGLDLLVRRYLGGFGPAPISDIASWAGLPAAMVRPVVERLDLRRFSDEQGRVLLDLRDAPLPDPETPAPVRFLPTWDATLLVHARRTEIISEELRPRIFNTKTPHSVTTFLVDGSVAGTWRYEKGRLDLVPLVPLSAGTTRDLEAEAERLAAFHAG